MEILELGKGYARVEFTSQEIKEAGSVFNAVALRLADDVNIRLITPIDYDKIRDVWLVGMRLTRDGVRVD